MAPYRSLEWSLEWLHDEFERRSFAIIDCIPRFEIDAHPPKYRQDGSNSPEKNVSKTGTILSEDYAEIVDEEGDYSTPASEY